TKRRIFLFFSSVVRKFLSISLFPLCPLFFVTALSPAPPEKPRTDFFTAQHFSLISAEENSHFAVCFARCRLRTESFFLQKIKKIQKDAAARKGRQHPLIIGSRSQHLLPYSQTGRRFSPPEP
uniref:hypothetical protein n=1 Tax=Gemmiger formicilis TaxID=745368 RepID=UPI00402A01E6